MRSNLFILLLWGLISFWTTQSYADENSKAGTVLFVHSQYGIPYTYFTEPLLSQLRSYDPSLNIEHIVLDNHEARLNRALLDKKIEKVKLAVAVGTIALRSLRDQKVLKADFPVIFGAVTDPVGEGVIDSFDTAPTGRFSGYSYAIDMRDRLRALSQVMPNAKRVGILYSTMPQSISYKKWIDKASKEKEFQHLEFVYRRIGMVADKNGPKLMIKMAERHLEAMAKEVDVFLSPVDQMGVLPEFAQTVMRVAKKPVFGLGAADVEAPMAAFAACDPNISQSGLDAAKMVIGLLEGKTIKDFPAKRPDYNVVYNYLTAGQLGVNLPLH